MDNQAGIINKILSTKDFSIVKSNNIARDNFFRYQKEFDYIASHYETYGVVPDVVTFESKFTDFELFDCSEPDAFLINGLLDEYNTDMYIRHTNTLKRALDSGDLTVISDIIDKISAEKRICTVLTDTDILHDSSRYDHYIEKTTDTAKYYLSTGFMELDEKTGGIDRENENMVIVARPGIGKTQVLIYMAVTAAMNGLRVGFYEGEMTKDKLGYRIDTYISHVSNSKINRGDLWVKKDYKKHIDSLNSAEAADKHIFVLTQNDVPGGSVTVDVLRQFIEKNKLDALFVDQYSLLEDTHTAHTEAEHVANIAKDIKKLQVEKHIPIISVSQMNRQKNEDKTQDTTQVAGSDKISQYATTIIALEQEREDDGSVQLTLNIIKARDGGDHNKLVYVANFDNGKFNYVNGENDGVTSDEELDAIEDSYAPVRQQNGSVF